MDQIKEVIDMTDAALEQEYSEMTGLFHGAGIPERMMPRMEKVGLEVNFRAVARELGYTEDELSELQRFPGSYR